MTDQASAIEQGSSSIAEAFLSASVCIDPACRILCKRIEIDRNGKQ
jgi:hypothetical protein